MLTPPTEASVARRLVAIVTHGDARTFARLDATARRAVRSGASVRVFFRDEAIPALCHPDVSERMSGALPAPAIGRALERMARREDTRLYACSSSLYLWGVTAADLLPSIQGSRGLITFLVEDLAGAEKVLTY